MSDTTKNITLFPSGVGDKHQQGNNCVSFNVKSNNIKVFPSSWRGVDFILDANGQVIPNAATMQFNPEATLNTEYNLTHSAGGIATYIEKIDEIDTAKHIFDLNFFLNGYHFEIYNLTLKPIYSSDLNLWACIRVDDLNIGAHDLDDTKVLMPYYWNALNTPIPLDTKLQDAYLIDEKIGSNFESILGKLAYTDADGNIVTASMYNEYIFTGLVLTTVQPNINNSANIYTIQLIKNGQACYSMSYPKQVRSGRTDGKSTIIGDEGLIASHTNMLAVGQYNKDDKLGDEEPLFVVGNGTNDTNRRNAFEVLGKISNDAFSQTVRFGNITFKHDNTIITDQSDMTGLRNINDGIGISSDGISLTVNQERESEENIGVHVYGNVDLIGPNNLNGAKLRFQDFDVNNPAAIKTISDFQIVEVATGKSNVIDPDARGLKMTNIHEINEKALVFKPCNAGIDRNKLRSINDGSIGIDDDALSKYQHSIEIGRNRTDESAALSLAGDKLVVKSEPGKGEFINNIRIEAQGSTGTDNLFNIAGIYNDNTSNTMAGITFDGDKITINGNVEIKGTSKFTGQMSFDESEGNADGGLKKYLLDFIYPVGSIYMCMDSKSPSDKFGGTWEQISKGRMLIGAGVNAGCGFDSGDEGGRFTAVLPPHNHELKNDNVKFNTTTTITAKSSNIGTQNTKVEFTHTFGGNNTSNSRHHHQIPVSFPSSTTGIDTSTDPKYFCNLYATGLQSGGDSWSYYTSITDRTWRYNHMLADMLDNPIPTVSTGSRHGNYKHNSCTWNGTSNLVKTGYYGLVRGDTNTDISKGTFETYVNRLWESFFGYNFEFDHYYDGQDGTGNEHANDNFRLRPHVEHWGISSESKPCELSMLYIPYEWAVVAGTYDTVEKAKEANITPSYTGLDDDELWAGLNTKYKLGWTIDKTKTVISVMRIWDSSNGYRTRFYKCYPCKCGKVASGHVRYHMMNNANNANNLGTSGTPAEDDMRDIYEDFMRDFFDAIGHAKMFYRPDGAHTHDIAKHSAEHSHQITTSNVIGALTTTSTTNLTGTTNLTESTGDTLNGTDNLPPYLVCYIWKRTA